MYEQIGRHLIPWTKNSWAPPFRIHIFPTDRCNLRCNSCWRWNFSLNGEIDSSQYELPRKNIIKIIEEAAELGVRTWEITGGGEPFVRKEIVIEMVRRIKELGMMGSINTNGTLFTPWIVQLLIDIGWDNLIISLDGPNPKTNDFLRPPKSFERIIKTLELFRERKTLYKTDKPIIYIHSVLSKVNFPEIIKMVNLAVQYNVSSINFEPIKEFSPNCKDLLIAERKDFDAIRRLAKEGSEIAQKNNLFTNLGSLLTTTELLEQSGKLTGFLKSFSEKTDNLNETKLLSVCCFEPWYRLFITTNGEVSPCCLGPFFKENVREKTLKEIWLGENFSNFRERILNRDLPQSCNNCNASLFTHSRHIQSLLKQALDEYKENKKINIFLKKVDYDLLNICLVSREYPSETGWGGIGTYTYHLAHGLADLGHNVHVIAQSLDYDKEYLDGNVFIHRITHPSIFPYKGRLKEFSLRLEYSYRVYQKIKELIEKYHIDIVEVPNFSAEGFVYSLFKRTPLVTRLHTHFSEVIEFSHWPKTLDRRLSCWLEDSTILSSDLVSCSTLRHKEIIFNEIGTNSKNVEIIPLGIPLPELKIDSFQDGHPFTVLFVGRLEERKGAHILFKAIPHVLESFPDTKFIIIGRDTYVTDDFIGFSGKDEHSFKAKLIKGIPEKYLNNIYFLDHVENKTLSRYYSSCDIFVAPSLYESFGLIYIEAMAHAKPVIGSGVGGVPEVIKHGSTGILVPPKDYNSLAGAIITLIQDEALREEIGKRGREYVQQNFIQDLMVERTLKAYRRILNKGI